MIKLDFAKFKKEKKEKPPIPIKPILIPFFVFLGIVSLSSILSGIIHLSYKKAIQNYTTTKAKWEEVQEKKREYTKLMDYKERLTSEINLLESNSKKHSEILSILNQVWYKASYGITIEEVNIYNQKIRLKCKAESKLRLIRYFEEIEKNPNILIESKTIHQLPGRKVRGTLVLVCGW